MTCNPDCTIHGDCVALRNSLSTRLLVKLRAGCPTPDEQGKLDALKDGWAGRDMARDGGPLNLAEMVKDIERWVVGDVEA